MLNESRRISNLVGVRFGLGGPVRYFDPGDIDLEVGDGVLVESEGVPREAVVVIAPGQVLYSELRGELEPVLQKVAPIADTSQ